MQRYELCLDNSGIEEDAAGDYCLFDEAESALAAAQSRIEKLERMVVWAVRHGAEFDDGRMWWFRLLSENSGPVDIEMENDSAPSILAAVEKAMGEAKS